MKKRNIALLLACVMLLGVAIGGSMAWLTDKTEEVKNTFTVSDVNITLVETTGENYKMIPGYTIEKNPLVTVKADSEPCWLFVKVKESKGVVTLADGTETQWRDFLSYDIGTNKPDKPDQVWTELIGTDPESKLPYAGKLEPGERVFYMAVTNPAPDEPDEPDEDDPLSEDVSYGIIKENKVTVDPDVTKEMMNALKTAGTDDYPTLTFTAYAIQYFQTNDTPFTPQAAWKNTAGYVDPATPNP